MGVSFNGFDAFDEKLAKIAEQSETKLNMAVSQEAEVIIGKIKDNTPVSPGGGRLREGWKRTNASKGKAVIYNNVEYAAHVEYGHRQKPGRYVPAIGKRLKKGFVPGKKMLHRGMLQASKTFEADAAAIVKELMDG